MDDAEARSLASGVLAEWQAEVDRIDAKKREAGRPVSRTVYEITTVERVSKTWCVYYNNRRYILTGDIGFALAGNGPVLVSEDGRVGQAGTGMPVEHYVAGFEQADPN